MVIAFSSQWSWWQLWAIFNVGAITDWLDGWLARKLSAESDFGKVFDPLMDKALTWSGFILLAITYPAWWLIVTVVILIARELLTEYWRWQLYRLNYIMAAIAGAKLKTTLQMIMINSIFAQVAIGWSIFVWLAALAAILAIIASISSAYSYGKRFYRLRSSQQS